MSSRGDIITALGDPDQQIRLAAARELADTAAPADIQLIRSSLANESVYWVRQALEEALSSAMVLQAPSREEPDELLERRLGQEGYSRALRDITRELAHELSPLIGAIDYFAAIEWDEYDGSRAAAAMERLRGAVEAIRNLSSAAARPKFEEFVLAERLQSILECESSYPFVVGRSGDPELVVRGDPALVDLAISNGFRNAIEATQGMGGADPSQLPILLAWGATDIDYWVTVRDEGAGLPESRDRAFELGVTNKPDHLGMGLAIARSAAASLEGVLDLRAGDHGGTVFELRWPRQGTGS